jgi:hypothetical protein
VRAMAVITFTVDSFSMMQIKLKPFIAINPVTLSLDIKNAVD